MESFDNRFTSQVDFKTSLQFTRRMTLQLQYKKKNDITTSLQEVEWHFNFSTRRRMTLQLHYKKNDITTSLQEGEWHYSFIIRRRMTLQLQYKKENDITTSLQEGEWHFNFIARRRMALPSLGLHNTHWCIMHLALKISRKKLVRVYNVHGLSKKM